MPPAAPNVLRNAWLINQGLIFPVLITASVLVLIAPLPPLMLDLLLSANITISVVILLTTIYVQRPLEFSVFPTILLGTTLARLVLNVASTRLILSHGASNGTAAAGGVIQAFGDFVAGGQVAIGLIIFVILIAIQFLVITKGATRISEVAARFALDGMPGKQMAIDADLNARIINPEQAKVRREEVAQQADFYGAMDGASKFVRGDAIASIVITLINVLGGIYIGMVNNGMPLAKAVEVFTKLTIGDGLVSQVPAFLISLASGLLTTRSSSDSNLPRDVVTQLFHHPEALAVSSAFLLALALTGLPALPLVGLSSACGLLSWSLSRGRKRESQVAAQRQVQEQRQSQAKPEPKPEDSLLVDPMELDLGVALIRLADVGSGGDLLERVTKVRNKIAQELGIILPKVRIRDNVMLEQRQYQIKIHGVPVAWGEVYAEGVLAIDTGSAVGKVMGVQTTEPAFGWPAVWIETAQKERAELMGYRVVEPSAVIATHLTEVVRKHSDELLSRQQVHQLLDNLKQSSPKVVEDLIPEMLKVPQLHQILGNLLRERVPIRNLDIILETLSDFADRTKDLGILTEYVRHGLSRSICQQYRDKSRVLHVVTLDPGLEDLLTAGIDYTERGMMVKLSPQVVDAVTRGLSQQLERLKAAGHPLVVLCSPQIRAGLKQITSSALPLLAVLSLNEVTRDTEVESVGQVGTEAVRGGVMAGAR
jgi:flagellar biosynthesis protein FlhA